MIIVKIRTKNFRVSNASWKEASVQGANEEELDKTLDELGLDNHIEEISRKDTAASSQRVESATGDTLQINKSNNMELIKFTSKKFQNISKEYPMHIAKRGDVVLSAFFVNMHKLGDSTHCLFFASPDGSKAEMYLSRDQIEDDDFAFYTKDKTHAKTGQLAFASSNISHMLKVDSTWFYKFIEIEPKAMHPEGLKIKGLTKITFELSKKIDLGHKNNSGNSVKAITEHRHYRKHSDSKKTGKPAAGKKIGAKNNTDFPSINGRQPWIRCTGCGGYGKDKEWIYKEERFNIGLCDKCQSPSKEDAYHKKIKQLEKS